MHHIDLSCPAAKLTLSLIDEQLRPGFEMAPLPIELLQIPHPLIMFCITTIRLDLAPGIPFNNVRTPHHIAVVAYYAFTGCTAFERAPGEARGSEGTAITRFVCCG